MILTFSGLYGSGGHELAYALASAFGFSVYGKELIADSVKDSGIDLHGTAVEYYDETGEKFAGEEKLSFSKALLALEMDVLPIGSLETIEKVESKGSGVLTNFMNTLPLNIEKTTKGVTEKEQIRKLVAAQTKVVNEAAKGDCIFLGRCASDILRDRDDCIRVFTTAAASTCRTRIREHYGKMSDKSLDELIERTNRRRALYFDTFTGKKWDDAANYDYCINVDALGFDGTLQLLKTLVELKKEANPA